MARRLILLALVAAAVAVPPASAAVAGIDLKGSSLDIIPKQTSDQLLVENPQKENTDGKSKAMTLPDSRVRNIKDQLIKAKVYLGLGAIRANPLYLRDLRQRIREVQKVLGDASKDSDLPKKEDARWRGSGGRGRAEPARWKRRVSPGRAETKQRRRLPAEQKPDH